MKIIEEYPPNYKNIASTFDLTGVKPLFTYGENIYNPHKVEICPDFVCHEEVHSKQQGIDPEGWWNKYLTNSEFRLTQEVDAYAVQYGFLRHLGFGGKKLSWYLERFAETLSSGLYGNVITFQKAKTIIRKTELKINA